MPDNLVADDTNAVADTFVRDRTTNTTSRISLGNLGEQCNDYCNDGVISGNGLYAAFSFAASNLMVNGYNGLTQLFIRFW